MGGGGEKKHSYTVVFEKDFATQLQERMTFCDMPRSGAYNREGAVKG